MNAIAVLKELRPHCDPEGVRLIDAALRNATGQRAPLTPTQKQILAFIEEHWRTRDFAPTLQEIADGLGVSKVTVFGHVGMMERKGWIVREKHAARSIRVVKDEVDDEG